MGCLLVSSPWNPARVAPRSSLFNAAPLRKIWIFHSLPHTRIRFTTPTSVMVRHKKDNFSSRGKKYSNPPRTRPPRGDEENGEGDSAASTSSRPPYKAAAWDLGHCDAKRCSGKRLIRLNLMRELHVGQKFAGVVVTPKGKKILSPADREVLDQYGAAVVEASWNRIEEVPFGRIGGKCERLCTTARSCSSYLHDHKLTSMRK